MDNSRFLETVSFITSIANSNILRTCLSKFLPANRRTRATLELRLSGGSLPAIRRRKDILHKLFKRRGRAVLRLARFPSSDHSCVDSLEHLDVRRGFRRRETHLRQHLLHPVIRKLHVTQIWFANGAANHRGRFRHGQLPLRAALARLFYKKN